MQLDIEARLLRETDVLASLDTPYDGGGARCDCDCGIVRDGRRYLVKIDEAIAHPLCVLRRGWGGVAHMRFPCGARPLDICVSRMGRAHWTYAFPVCGAPI